MKNIGKNLLKTNFFLEFLQTISCERGDTDGSISKISHFYYSTFLNILKRRKDKYENKHQKIIVSYAGNYDDVISCAVLCKRGAN